MSFKNWSDSNENNGFSYAMPREMAQQQLRMSLRLVILMGFASCIAVLALVRTPIASPAIEEVQQRRSPAMTFVADNSAIYRGSAKVHVGSLQ